MVADIDLNSRQEGAMLGLFIGDALAMPVHWYYDREALARDYGKVTGYLSPRNPHPDSILWRSRYPPPSPSMDILHDQRQYWGRRGIHYHQFLKAGENTLNLKLCRLLIDLLVEKDGYDADEYLKRYIDFMTSPDSHRDTYVEEYHRHFFTNYVRGGSPRDCGAIEKHISGIIGMVPLIVYYAGDPELGRRLAFEHLRLTHLGNRMEAAGHLIVELLQSVLSGESLLEVLTDAIRRQRHPLLGHPFFKWLTVPDDIVVGQRLSTACYVQDAIPATIYLALKYHQNARQGLIANTNLGGDNAGRGAVLGALLGAANGVGAFPTSWIEGLHDLPSSLKRR